MRICRNARKLVELISKCWPEETREETTYKQTTIQFMTAILAFLIFLDKVLIMFYDADFFTFSCYDVDLINHDVAKLLLLSYPVFESAYLSPAFN